MEWGGGQTHRGKLILKQFPCEYNFQNLLLSKVRKVIFLLKRQDVPLSQ